MIEASAVPRLRLEISMIKLDTVSNFPYLSTDGKGCTDPDGRRTLTRTLARPGKV